MKIYMAPMEGITGYIFRNAYEKYYGGIDKYFAPFLSPVQDCVMTPRERRDVCPENNQGITLVPQILTCRREHFTLAALALREYGYREVNLNLGCPSGTVCAKGKGAGFLAHPEELERFLDGIYEDAIRYDMRISIKTRIGKASEAEWSGLLELFNRFPIAELIVHPRLAADYYKGIPRESAFAYALVHSVNPVVYNGDLFTVSAVEQRNILPAVMLGRGLLFCPCMTTLLHQENGNMHYPDSMRQADGMAYETSFCKKDIMRFWNFHNALYEGYREIMSPDINVLYRMKELWTYWRVLFPEGNRAIKELMKSKRFCDYEAALAVLGRR